MRCITALLLLMPTLLNAQKIALLDKGFKRPIIYTDSVTAEQLDRYFPVEQSSVDTLYAGLLYLKNMLNERQRSKMISFELKAGNTTLKTVSIPRAYGDHFDITAQTKSGELISKFPLTSTSNNNSRNAKRIGELLAYIDKNHSLFTNPSEIHPKFYNIVVVSK